MTVRQLAVLSLALATLAILRPALRGASFNGTWRADVANSDFGAVGKLPKGWYLTSAPVITANWKSDGSKWVIPFGGGMGKIFRVGKQAMNAQVQVFWGSRAAGGCTVVDAPVRTAVPVPEVKT